ncbi:cell wall hydrolase [uncultured Enterovirga sp.]|uniref:cell wall hydrolase n=1 Tax=uncultured Enterovirga sp. TaxID=2026352 RepID=UPI0035CB2C0B
MARPLKAAPAAAVVVTALSLGGCGHIPFGNQMSLTDRDCLARVMYFESNRSSPDGMLGVGTVVMNRLQSRRYPKTVCGVVGQQNQFAEGALTKPMSGRSQALAYKVADEVLAGERHDKVGGAMFFHTSGHTFPYRNMAYVAAAGGNVFYEKRPAGTFDPIHPATLVARAEPGTAAPRPAPVRVAAAAVEEDDQPAPRSTRQIRPERSARLEPDRIVVASATPAAPRKPRPQPSITELIETDLGQAGPVSSAGVGSSRRRD